MSHPDHFFHQPPPPEVTTALTFAIILCFPLWFYNLFVIPHKHLYLHIFEFTYGIILYVFFCFWLILFNAILCEILLYVYLHIAVTHSCLWC